jgi:hypothetical protein
VAFILQNRAGLADKFLKCHRTSTSDGMSGLGEALGLDLLLGLDLRKPAKI